MQYLRTIAWLCLVWAPKKVTYVHQQCTVCMQGFQADVLVGEPPHLCIQVLASKLDKAIIGFSPLGPRDPFSTSIYSKSSHRAFLPNPPAYVPQTHAGIATQHMVSSLVAFLMI